MLNLNAQAIESAAQLALVELVDKLLDEKRKGRYDKASWQKAINASRLLDSLSLKDKLTAAQLSNLDYIYECLITTLDLNDLPASISVSQTIVSPPTIVGLPGSQGEDGVSSYLYFAFADDQFGTGFTAVYSTTKAYLAFIQSTAPILTPTSAMFDGRWLRILGTNGGNGEDGNNGTNGVDGQDGNTIHSGTSAPSSLTGENGDYFIDYLSWNVYGPKAADVWPAGIDMIGTSGLPGNDGLDGNSLLNGVSDPVGGDGEDGDFYINTATVMLFGPKTGGVWPAGISLIGTPGTPGGTGDTGAAGNDGDSSYTYIAYADDSAGNDFSLTSDLNRNYIAFKTTTTELDPPIASDFDGLWIKFKGSGDRWSTYSVSSITVGLGVKTLIVEEELAYVTGQFIVVAVDGDPSIRMEGYVINYNPGTGQMTFEATVDEGAGTYVSWDVSLQGGTPTASPSIYAGASPTTLTVGGIPAGTAILGLTYDALWEMLLVPYLSPAFSSFIISGQSTTVEVGTSISGTKTFTWGTTNSGNVAVNTIVIRDETGTTDLVTGSANDATEAVGVGTVTKTTPASHVWRIKGTDTDPGGAVEFTRDFTVTWMWRKHWGTSTSTTLDEAAILALTSSALDSDFEGDLSFAAGGYKYLVYDDDLGAPTALTGFKDTATNLSVSMADSSDHADYSNVQNGWYYAIVSVTNAEGITSDKRVYRTKNILGGAINIEVS
jgi:hypothetical protein